MRREAGLIHDNHRTWRHGVRFRPFKERGECHRPGEPILAERIGGRRRGSTVRQRAAGEAPVNVGQTVGLMPDPSSVLRFDAAGRRVAEEVAA